MYGNSELYRKSSTTHHIFDPNKSKFILVSFHVLLWHVISWHDENVLIPIDIFVATSYLIEFSMWKKNPWFHLTIRRKRRAASDSSVRKLSQLNLVTYPRFRYLGYRRFRLISGLICTSRLWYLGERWTERLGWSISLLIGGSSEFSKSQGRHSVCFLSCVSEIILKKTFKRWQCKLFKGIYGKQPQQQSMMMLRFESSYYTQLLKLLPFLGGEWPFCSTNKCVLVWLVQKQRKNVTSSSSWITVDPGWIRQKETEEAPWEKIREEFPTWRIIPWLGIRG